MSEHVDGLHRKQTILFPDTLDKYVDEENPVRFIDAFVDSLDLEKLGFKHYPMRYGTAFLQPVRLAQALRVRLLKPGPIQQKARKRMLSQP